MVIAVWEVISSAVKNRNGIQARQRGDGVGGGMGWEAMVMLRRRSAVIRPASTATRGTPSSVYGVGWRFPGVQWVSNGCGVGTRRMVCCDGGCLGLGDVSLSPLDSLDGSAGDLVCGRRGGCVGDPKLERESAGRINRSVGKITYRTGPQRRAFLPKAGVRAGR